MNEYLDMWKNFANFNDCTSRRGYWMAYLFNFLAALLLGVIAGFLHMEFLGTLYGYAVLIPSLAITVRRLRDAGFHWANLFWAFLPVIGTIILIVKLCKPSAQNVTI